MLIALLAFKVKGIELVAFIGVVDISEQQKHFDLPFCNSNYVCIAHDITYIYMYLSAVWEFGCVLIALRSIT